jgi:hypothetical protein
MIDRFSLDLAELDDADSIGGSIWGEQNVGWDGSWAVLAGGGLGTISPDNAGNIDYWRLGLGLKYYFTELNSLALLGHYTDYDDCDAKAATLFYKQRLWSAKAQISPFGTASATLRDRSTFSDPECDDSVSEFVFTLGGGCDFAASENLVFSFEGGYAVADESDDGAEDLDGLVLTFSMVYYLY